MTKRIAFLTLDDPGDYVIDDELAIDPLEDSGWRVNTVPWRQENANWVRFDAVVIRSTWDYFEDLDGFLAALGNIDTATRLANPLELVRWNARKTYMRDLEEKGIAIVRTSWPDAVQAEGFDTLFEELDCKEIVIKPVVGASGYDTFRVSGKTPADRLRQIDECLGDRPAMAQPFMPRILDEGEFSLFYFNGEYSHCVLKVPAAGEFRSQEERGGAIRAVQPPGILKSLGEQALAALDTVPLYARTDFIRDEDNHFLLMELELVEPSLYLRADPAAPRRFATAIDRWFDGARSRVSTW